MVRRTIGGMQPLPDWYDDLLRTRHHAWRQLERAVHDRHAPLRTPMLGTVAEDGAPSVRTVILRHADEAAWRVVIHTDRRSRKAAEFARDSRVALTGYDHRHGFQLRLQGVAIVHAADAIAAAAWARLPPGSRRNYRAQPAPGTPVPTATDGLATAACADEGETNFALVVIEVASVETLCLHAAGHRRARFTREGNEWLIP